MIFFAMSKEQIDGDLASIPKNLPPTTECIKAHGLLPLDVQTPDSAALFYHNQMIQGHALQQLTNLSEDERLYLAALPAQLIADQACEVAMETGELSELARKMDEIEKCQGLAPHEYWPARQGPPRLRATPRPGR